MTAADMLDELTVFNNELDVDAGEDDETRALRALNMAQTLFEAVVASESEVLSRAGDANIATIANQEYTDWPTDLLRVDSVWLFESAGVPVFEVTNIFKSGGQAQSLPWPLSLGVARSSSPGAPRQFKADYKRFWWAPTPSAVHSLRVYGAWRGVDLTTRAVTFSFPDECSIPISTVASRMLRMGVDDPTDEVTAFSKEVYKPVMKRLRRLVRSRPEPREYRYLHTT